MKNIDKQFSMSALTQQDGQGREPRKSVSFKKDMLAYHGLAKKSQSIVDLTRKSKPGADSDLQQVPSRNTSQKTISNFSETSQSEGGRWEESPGRRGTTRRRSSNNRLSRQKTRSIEARGAAHDTEVKLLSKPQENLYKRVAEYEKLAKQLEKDLEERANMHHINQYFEKPPSSIQAIAVDQTEQSDFKRNHRFSIVQINNKFGQSAQPSLQKENSAEKESTSKREVLSNGVNKLKSLFGSKQSDSTDKQSLIVEEQKTLRKLNTLSGSRLSANGGLNIEQQEFSQASFGVSNGSSLAETFQQEHRAASVQPFDGERDQPKFLSKLIDNESEAVNMFYLENSSQMSFEGGKQTYFAPATKLNDSAMIEYGLRKGVQTAERKHSADRSQGDDDNLLMDDLDEFLERFDSRGAKMKLRRGQVAHPPLHSQRLQQSYAVVDFHPNTLITQKDLKLRATSVVYGKYKHIKHEYAVMENQRRLNWFRSIVIAKKFARFLLLAAQDKISKEKEEAERQEHMSKQLQRQLTQRSHSRQRMNQNHENSFNDSGSMGSGSRRLTRR